MSQEQCDERFQSLQGDIQLLYSTLIGQDLRGGIVKDIQEIKADVKALKQASETQNSEGRVVSRLLAEAGVVGLILYELVKIIFGSGII